MKKLTSLLVLASAIIALSFTGSADFEGKVVYSIDISGGNMPPQAKSMMQGSTATVYVKGDKAKTEMNMGMQTTTSFYDRKTNTSVTLMEIMGNKYKLKPEEKKDEKKPDVKTNITSETKTIAGYVCKKAEVTMTDAKGAHTFNIWFTEDIPNHINTNHENGYQFKDIKGMPLEYEIEAKNGMTMKMTATSVSKETIDDSKFVIPDGYKEMTAEEMQQDLMKNMQQH